MKSANEMILFTNRNCLVYDKDIQPIEEYQAAINCYSIDKKLALQATNEATIFYISKFNDWSHPITREEMQHILGLVERGEKI